MQFNKEKNLNKHSEKGNFVYKYTSSGDKKEKLQRNKLLDGTPYISHLYCIQPLKIKVEKKSHLENNKSGRNSKKP